MIYCYTLNGCEYGKREEMDKTDAEALASKHAFGGHVTYDDDDDDEQSSVESSSKLPNSCISSASCSTRLKVSQGGPQIDGNPVADSAELPCSHYGLQIAMRGMKDRYQKLQRHMSRIEDENRTLVHGKSELFGEIGKMQESTIRLREKNLQLNQEVHARRQECCSVNEKYSILCQEHSALSQQVAKSMQDEKELKKQLNQLRDENDVLREKIIIAQSQVRQLPQDFQIYFKSLDVPGTSLVVKSGSTPDEDSLCSRISLVEKEFEHITLSEVVNATVHDSSFLNGNSLELEASLEAATDKMRKIMLLLKEQNKGLLSIGPAVQAALSAKPEIAVEACEDDPYISRLATCNSSGAPLVISGLTMSPGIDTSSEGDNNVYIEHDPSRIARPNSPFNWKNVEMSDDEDNATLVQTRSTATSPPLGLDVPDSRICPMCQARFPPSVLQEIFESHVVGHFETENGFEVL